mgnify:CR=1 FL=1
MPLKCFERFAHAGVRRELEALRDIFVARGCDIGSSHDGEITIRFQKNTAYVRRHRDGRGWRVHFWTANRQDPYPSYFEQFEDVIGFLKDGGL